MKLTSMMICVGTQKAELVSRRKDSIGYIGFAKAVIDHHDFLSQGLDMGNLVPCKDGVPLKEPEGWTNFLEYSGAEVKGLKPELYEYQQAKERVLFEGFSTGKNGKLFLNRKVFKTSWKLNEGRVSLKHRTVRDLVEFDLTLTETAKKQLGL